MDQTLTCVTPLVVHRLLLTSRMAWVAQELWMTVISYQAREIAISHVHHLLRHPQTAHGHPHGSASDAAVGLEIALGEVVLNFLQQVLSADAPHHKQHERGPAEPPSSDLAQDAAQALHEAMHNEEQATLPGNIATPLTQHLRAARGFGEGTRCPLLCRPVTNCRVCQSRRPKPCRVLFA